MRRRRSATRRAPSQSRLRQLYSFSRQRRLGTRRFAPRLDKTRLAISSLTHSRPHWHVNIDAAQEVVIEFICYQQMKYEHAARNARRRLRLYVRHHALARRFHGCRQAPHSHRIADFYAAAMRDDDIFDMRAHTRAPPSSAAAPPTLL